MRAFGKGILPDSQIYIYDASAEAKKLYLHLLCVGHYHCDRSYLVDRKSYDSFLLLYIAGGTAYYIQDNIRHELNARDFALVDCYHNHVYGTDNGCEMYWAHLDGPTARDTYEKLKSERCCRPSHFDRCRNGIVDLCTKSEKRGHIPEPEINRILTTILMDLLLGQQKQEQDCSDIISEVRAYIDEHPEKDLDLQSLAERAQMSPYHFLRRFKEQVGKTPYDYLLHARLNIASFYLISSDYSVKEISFSCGFSGVSNFCTCFKNHVGMTPSEYRNRHTSHDENR